MFQEPYRSADEELAETLERGRRRAGPSGSPVTARGVAITVAWVAVLFAIGALLLVFGVIDTEFCHGTMNPASC